MNIKIREPEEHSDVRPRDVTLTQFNLGPFKAGQSPKGGFHDTTFPVEQMPQLIVAVVPDS